MTLRQKLTSLDTNESARYVIISGFFLSILAAVLITSREPGILGGLYRIIISPDTLITDYTKVGGVAAAFTNSSILSLIIIFMFYKNEAILSGPAIAAIFTVGGFSLFGKNLFNVWPVIFGVYLYSVINKEPFRNNILVAAFSTGLSPLVSEIAFAMDLSVMISIPLAIFIGTVIGLIIVPLSRSFMSFHHGYNLYNVGFTAGLIGSALMSTLITFGVELKGQFTWAQGNNDLLIVPSILFSLLLIVTGLLICPEPIVRLKRIFHHSGRAVTDFVVISGFGATLINIGTMSLIGILYLLVTRCDFNGPTLGAVYTMAGFSAFGVHPKNAVPPIFGVFLAAYISVFDVNAPGPALAAIFSTTLAPIAGGFGAAAGVVAGMLHLMLVMNTGQLHGGLNLYNNGFSGGIIAALMLPILDKLKKH